MIKIRRGLDLPITGEPAQSISDGNSVRTAAIVGFDYHGMKPTMEVKVGDKVKRGQLLFTDKKTPGVRYTSPASGTVAEINRGYQRVLQSVVIEIAGDEAESFEQYPADALSSLSVQDAENNLVASGLWTAFRTRPYSKVPALGSKPSSIFVTAIDTNPLAADPAVVLAEKADNFKQGLAVLTCLTEGKVFVCHKQGVSLPKGSGANLSYQAFDGVHPAGNAGTHIHYLDPVHTTKTVWTINYQDVVAIGHLFTTGTLNTERVVSLAGPQVQTPTLVRTCVGANLQELTAGKLKEGESRLISGSVFGGRNTNTATAYLGRYHTQVSVLAEGRERPLFHYMQAGTKRFSALPIYISRFFKNQKFDFTTSTNGSERAMVPIGSYERVMPLDILPTQLLRAIIVGDTDMAQKLGCLELEEEDLALCTFVCSGKYEFGPILRENLTQIEKEG